MLTKTIIYLYIVTNRFIYFIIQINILEDKMKHKSLWLIAVLLLILTASFMLVGCADKGTIYTNPKDFWDAFAKSKNKIIYSNKGMVYGDNDKTKWTDGGDFFAISGNVIVIDYSDMYEDDSHIQYYEYVDGKVKFYECDEGMDWHYEIYDSIEECAQECKLDSINKPCDTFEELFNQMYYCGGYVGGFFQSDDSDIDWQNDLKEVNGWQCLYFDDSISQAYKIISANEMYITVYGSSLKENEICIDYKLCINYDKKIVIPEEVKKATLVERER